jgi:integral membrane protein (TIGR00529 family)
MDRLVESFAHLAKDARTVGVVMAALIGLLPMPGGALFSAPMVETSLSKHRVTKEQKTLVNYWFRHIWEYWWPLYPGVVLAVALLEVNTWHYMVVMAPLTLISLAAGIIFILRPIGKTIGNHDGGLSLAGIKAFLWEMLPILIVVLFIIILAGVTSLLRLFGSDLKIPGAISILPGLGAATIWICFINHIPFRQFKSAVLDKSIPPMILLLMAIMVFKGIMIDSQAVVQVRNELIAYRIPVTLVIMIMPFLSGLITGIALGFVGTSFPLIIPMFPNASLFGYLTFAALAYTFGYMGMMLSPVHLCLLVTKDYYKASLLKSYRLLIMPAVTVMLTALALFSIIRLF